jgi:hypothetical protein
MTSFSHYILFRTSLATCQCTICLCQFVIYILPGESDPQASGTNLPQDWIDMPVCRCHHYGMLATTSPHSRPSLSPVKRVPRTSAYLPVRNEMMIMWISDCNSSPTLSIQTILITSGQPLDDVQVSAVASAKLNLIEARLKWRHKVPVPVAQTHFGAAVLSSKSTPLLSEKQYICDVV